MSKHMVLGLSLDAAGHHPGAWRLADFDAGRATDARHFIHLGEIAEEARLDFLLAGYPVRSSAVAGPAFSQSAQLEPLSLIAALLPHVRRIGLAAQMPMAYGEPFNIARAFAALDNLSGGRSAWLAVPQSGPDDEANFPRFAHQHVTAPYERAAEFIELVRALWDSWEDGALRFDKENAVFTDRDKVHRIAFKGKYFTSDGPLNAPRPPQGHPPVLVSDLSPEGQRFASAHADLALCRETAPAAAAALRARLGVPRLLADLNFVLGASDAEAQRRAAELNEISPSPPAAGLAFAGTAQGRADLMAGWFARGACDGFNLLPATMSRDLTAFASEVVPLLRAKGLFRGDYDGGTLREHLGLARPAGRAAIAGAA